MSSNESEYLIRPDRDAISAPNGSFDLSADIIPQRASRSIRRIVGAVLLAAGLLGGAFQAMQSLRIVSAVVNSPHTHHR